MTLGFSVSLSAIDEKRFGIRTAKAILAHSDDLSTMLDFCQEHRVTFLITRCSTQDLSIAQMLEQAGFFLTDTLVYHGRDLLKTPIPEDTGPIEIRCVQPGDELALRTVAADSFRGYFGHYHADGRLAPAKCDEVYVDWAVRSCLSRDVADEVLIADDGGTVVGFATLQLNSAEEGEGVLFGVAPAAQGKGVYRSFMIQGMQWCLSKGRRRMVVSTQVTNIAVQKVWARLGFELSHSYYTFHKWFL
jgi:GNAT superfamily N-acetyltransferase